MEPGSPALLTDSLPTELLEKPEGYLIGGKILIWWQLLVPLSVTWHYSGHARGSDGKASVYNAGDPGSIPGLGRSPGGQLSSYPDAFELWCWIRLLRVPWTARSSNQSILQEISLEYSLERPLLKLKLQYFGHLMWRTNSLEKTLMLGKIEGEEGNNRGWDGQMTSQTLRTWVWVSSESWWKTGKRGMLWSMGLQKVRHDWATELNWVAKTHRNHHREETRWCE